MPAQFTDDSFMITNTDEGTDSKDTIKDPSTLPKKRFGKEVNFQNLRHLDVP